MGAPSLDDLPEETAVEILLKLPVKDIIRSTSVNKTWYSIINNPSFISSQISRCVSHCDENDVLIIPPFTSHQNYCSLISAHTSELIQKLDIPFDTKNSCLRLVAQIHGLLLLTDFNELYLWNPYVKRNRLLASSYYKKLLDDLGMSYWVAGMGYDKANDDYKVVRIIYVGDDKDNLSAKLAPKVEVYSLRNHTWRTLKDPGVGTLVHGYGIYVNDCYYWLELESPGRGRASSDQKLRVVSFDFDNELFGAFKVPDCVPHSLGKCCPLELLKFENSLALCLIGLPLIDEGEAVYPYYIMSMKHENGVVAWTLCFKFVLKEFGYPFHITKDGTVIMESVCSESDDVTSIVSYDLKSMTHKDHGFGNLGRPEVSQYVRTPSTVDTSFPQSLIMYEGGKLLLKHGK